MPDRVEQEAALWALRHPLVPAEERALDAWLSQDRRHPGALLRALAALSMIDRAVVGRSPEAQAQVHPEQSRPTRRWFLGGIGSVAAVALGLVGWPRLRGERVTTLRGEIRRLPLVDGSVATIDTESELHLVMASDSRRIALARGQAWFQVAKDRDRPFIVDAGIAQVRAVGTAFSVRRIGERVEVSVTEGTVVTWPTGAKGTMSVLTQGQYATFASDREGPQTGTAPAEINRSLAWREGEISLEGETLANAVAEFNRYNNQQFVLTDPTLGSERLVGLFKIDNPIEFAQMLEKTLAVTTTVTSTEIRLSRKNSPAI